jgi:hypothetical protein
MLQAAVRKEVFRGLKIDASTTWRCLGLDLSKLNQGRNEEQKPTVHRDPIEIARYPIAQD